MNKMKTKKSIAKRFRITGNGKVIHRRSKRRHRSSHHSRSQKSKKKMTQLSGRIAKKIKKALGK